MPPPAPAAAPAAPAPAAPSGAPPSGTLSDLVRGSFAEAAAASQATSIAPEGAAPVTSPEAPPAPALDEPPIPAEPAAAAPVTVPDPNAAPAEPVAPALTEADLDFSDGTDPDSQSQDGKRHFFSEGKSRRLQQAGKLVQGLQEVMPAVTLDAVRERIETANAADVLLTAFDQGAAQSVDEVLELFHGRNPQNFGVMAIRALQQLPTVNPEANKVIERHFQQSVVKTLYNRAIQTQEPNAQATAIALAQQADLAINGTFTPKAQLLAQGVQDPMKMREASLAQREQALNQTLQQQRQQAEQNFSNHLGTSQESAIMSTIDEALAPAAALKGTPQWDQMRQELRLAVDAAEKAHPEWAVPWQTYMSRASLSKSETDVQAVANYRKSVTRQVARTNAQAIIQRASQAVAQQNQTAHQRAAAQPAAEVSPNGGAVSRPADGALQKAIANPDLKASLRELFAAVPGGR